MLAMKEDARIDCALFFNVLALLFASEPNEQACLRMNSYPRNTRNNAKKRLTAFHPTSAPFSRLFACLAEFRIRAALTRKATPQLSKL
jgi:hypothetical protein